MKKLELISDPAKRERKQGTLGLILPKITDKLKLLPSSRLSAGLHDSQSLLHGRLTAASLSAGEIFADY